MSSIFFASCDDGNPNSGVPSEPTEQKKDGNSTASTPTQHPVITELEKVKEDRARLKEEIAELESELEGIEKTLNDLEAALDKGKVAKTDNKNSEGKQ